MADSTIAVPIEPSVDGVLHVGGTRVTLDTIVTAFQAGASAEEIALRYPSLELADVYAAISYYLQHQAEVEVYLQQRSEYAARVRAENESRYPDASQIRQRLLARRAD